MDSQERPSFNRAAEQDFVGVIRRYSQDRANLIPILHALQDEFGYIPSYAMDEVASWLSVPVSEVYGTATFYTLFQTEPKGRYVIRMCDSTPCHIEGSKSIRKALEAQLGVMPGSTTRDGNFTLQIVSCLGLCGVSPSIMIGQDVYGNLTPEMIPAILAKYREGGA